MDELRELSLYADGTRIAEGCRMRLKGRATMSLRPDLWELTLFDPPASALAVIYHAKNLSVEGAERSSLGYGQVEEVYSHKEDGKSMVTVLISDGTDFWNSTVAISLAGGNMLSRTIRTLAMNCTCPVPINVLQLRDATLFRGQAFQGRTASYIAALAKSGEARAYYVRGSLCVICKGSGSDQIILAEDDLLNDVAEANGICVVRLAGMKGYPIGQLVALPDRSTKYRLLCQTVEADNYEGPWKTELVMVDENQVETWTDWGGG